MTAMSQIQFNLVFIDHWINQSLVLFGPNQHKQKIKFDNSEQKKGDTGTKIYVKSMQIKQQIVIKSKDSGMAIALVAQQQNKKRAQKCLWSKYNEQ